MQNALRAATRPTMYFIGVTTRQSSINAIFPQWARRLGLGECELRGVDLPLHAEPAAYRRVVDFIRGDPLSLGALVTSHKLDLYRACHDRFDAIEPVSDSLEEISSIYKRAGRLQARSVDPWTVGYALAAVVPAGHWPSGAEILILGAGGAGSALAWHLSQASSGLPRRVLVADRQPPRLERLRQLHGTWRTSVALEAHCVTSARAADELVAALPPGSLVVNATGAGKDTPGSPLSDGAVFPRQGFAWDFNYRGELLFLQQARAQQSDRALRVEDGWIYFLHGWMQVMADVFDREIPTRGPLFDELGRLAGNAR